MTNPTTKRKPGKCWCGRKTVKGWTTCPRHYTSGRKATK